MKGRPRMTMFRATDEASQRASASHQAGAKGIARSPDVLAVCASFLFALGGCSATSRDPHGLHEYASPDGLYSLYKPAGWIVQQEGDRNSLYVVAASPAGTSLVEFFYAPNAQSTTDSVRLIAMFSQTVRSRCRDLELSELYASPDRAKSVASVSYTRNGVAVSGKYYFSAEPQYVSIIGYCAPTAELAQQRDMLLNILTNLRFPSGPVNAGNAAAVPSLRPIDTPLVQRRAQDGSATIAIPADWSFHSTGGRTIAAAHDGSAGFVFTSVEVLPSNYGVAMPAGVFVSPYCAPSDFIRQVFSRYGNRDVQVVESQPDNDTIRAFPAYVGRQCQAEDMVVRYVSPQGARCVGAFKMINATPSIMGQWFSIISGFWAPEAEFPRYVPLLEKIGSSYGISDQYARNYIQQGLANLRRLQQQTMQKMQELNQARYDNQAAWEARQARKDFMDSKWDDYRRGQSFWVSEMEGGKVYATDPWGTRDTETGEYYEGGYYKYTHFDGENPRHPSETMREISSYEVNNYKN
ncbi:MAG: hypothetical protein AB1714_09225 [Acidobacteriota bacterium]